MGRGGYPPIPGIQGIFLFFGDFRGGFLSEASGPPFKGEFRGSGTAAVADGPGMPRAAGSSPRS
ncbi:MAG: hypothetical protein CMP28_00195 [Roseibacillus sp.]|nr:hypothetical protein [Roseibacillus sp.]